MIISYKKQFPWGNPTNFEQKILSGQKIHTMREDKHGRWKAGLKMHHSHGVRTKLYDCFLVNSCISTQKIEIKHYGEKQYKTVRVLIDGKIRYFSFDNDERETLLIEALAKNDGFDSVDDFFKWFNADFSGNILHWTDFRY